MLQNRISNCMDIWQRFRSCHGLFDVLSRQRKLWKYSVRIADNSTAIWTGCLPNKSRTALLLHHLSRYQFPLYIKLVCLIHSGRFLSLITEKASCCCFSCASVLRLCPDSGTEHQNWKSLCFTETCLRPFIYFISYESLAGFTYKLVS